MTRRTPKQRQRIIDGKIFAKGALTLLFIPWTIYAITCTISAILCLAGAVLHEKYRTENATWGCFYLLIPPLWTTTLRWYLRFDPYRLPAESDEQATVDDATPTQVPVTTTVDDKCVPPIDPGQRSTTDRDGPTIV